MQVKIAGYNLDHSQIQKLEDKSKATPETISAAYARISRSSKSVGELRKEALEDVSKTRSSNQTIVFEMGHASVAEHAVFNFDITGISRLLVEDLQRSRLASFTEKSQRYVTLKGDFVIPPEIAGSSLETEFVELIEEQNKLYYMLYDVARDYLLQNQFAGSKRDLQGKAKEDARYVLALATQTQLGMTINARSLERLLQRLDKNPLREAAELKEKLLKAATAIAPSLVRYSCCSKYEKSLKSLLPAAEFIPNKKDIDLVYLTPEADSKILAGLLFEQYGGDWRALQDKALKMNQEEKKCFFAEMMKEMEIWDKMPRAYESVDLAFNVLISSSCFGQLKRHRLSTILRSAYDPRYGRVTPALLQKLNASRIIEPVLKKSEEIYYKLEKIKPSLGAYILTNSHRLSVYFKTNLRELYHFSRLRSDAHAQWEIRELSQKIDSLIKEKIPLAGAFMMGKDEFEKCQENGAEDE